jgi:hypothetical protein
MAISILEDATRRMPDSVNIAQILIESYLSTKQLQKVRDFALSIIPLIDKHPELSIALARIHEKIDGDADFLEGCIRRFAAIPEFWLLSVASSEQPLAILKTQLCIARTPSKFTLC